MRLNFLSIPLYFTVFATGAAGLIFQVTWQRYLSRLVGSDSMATAIILAIFLGGLSLGYYLCGKLSTRVSNHFKAYALLEGIIGAWCLYFPTLFKTVESLTQSWSFSLPIMIVLQGSLCSAFLMGIPTICMGGTIPLLTRGISRNIAEATRIHAKVYSINTAGAFLGALLAGFYLIPNHGLPMTVMGTAFLNLGAGLFFFVISKVTKQTEPSESAGETINAAARLRTSVSFGFPSNILYFISFLSGFYVMTLENSLIRITNLSLGSSSYTFSIIVSVFVLSIAIGSYVVGKFKHFSKRILFMNQLFITLLLLAIYTSLDTWPYWAHIIRITFQSSTAGFWGYYIYVFLAIILILILPVGLMGATMPIIFHELKRDLNNVGKLSGILFSLNTIGSLTGSLIGGIVFYYFFNIAEVFLLAVLFAGFSTCLAGRHLAKRYFLPAIFLAVTILLFIIFSPFYNEKNFMFGTFRMRAASDYSLSGPGTFFKKRNAKHELKFYKDGPTSTVAVVESPKHPAFDLKPMSIISNGKSDSSTILDIYTLRLSAHIPALLASKRENILVIGLGTGVTAGELTLYADVKHIDIAEISPSVVEALPYFEKFTYGVHKDPRVSIHIGDAFRILGRSKKKWDIIVSELSNPWVTGVDLLFTKKYYELAKEHLTEDGILLQWAHTYSASPFMVGMIVNTIQQEFKQCRVFMASRGDLLILASNKSIAIGDLSNAEKTLNINKKVKASLETINIQSLESILIREIWTPSYISDNFSGFGIQTIDNPRLHYIAGKRFFIGKSVSPTYLLNSRSSAYFHEYLIVKKYNNWKDSPLSKESFDSLLHSIEDKIFGTPTPMANALKLKGYLSNPELFPLSDDEKKAFRVDLLPFIMDRPLGKKDWDKVGLGGASYRNKALTLLSYVKQSRNWIVPYPVEGLKAILQEGFSNAHDAYEKNWFALQTALIFLEERADKQLVQAILDQTIRGDDGKIILKEQDKILLKIINRRMKS